ncbi:MAG TPA: DUF1800 domain-containing protein [Tepidisphaeraceae bacterium]|jgi:uncharacterized protein (DUF1800 family)
MAKLHPMLEPFGQAAGEEWDRVHAAHLLNRCAFGGTDADVDAAHKLGPAGAVDKLLDFPDAPIEETTQTGGPDLSGLAEYPRTSEARRALFDGKTQEERKLIQQRIQQANNEAVRTMAGWWMDRMAEGPYPLQEKLTFFWHGHFTTSARDERSAWLMWQQNETLRTHAAGNFGKFVDAIAHDPAMLDYLNNQQNRKARPNENFARELMELFTLGIGHYTENDVKEAARAFTGWAHDGEAFIFRKFDHDTGEKSFLGRRGDFDGGDVINIILQQPICGTHMATRLWRFFVSEDPDMAVCQSLGHQLRESNYELRPVLRTLFASRAFHSTASIGALIKSPVQLVVGLARQLGLDELRFGRMRDALRQMGQEPLMPPNVKGWPGGRQWINTSTLLVRQNTALNIVADRAVKLRPPRDVGLGRAALVDAWVDRLIQRPIHPQRRQILEDALGTNVNDNALRGMIGLIVSMPEFQLC